MEENPAVETQAEPTKQDLYTRHVDNFVELAGQDFAKALGQYGFSVWHSLPAKDAAVLKERLGAKPLDAADLFNRGTAAAMEGDFQKAVTDLRAALKDDPDFARAAFNLALCLEKMERFDDARDAYRQYLKMLDRVRDRAKLGLASDAEIAQEAARVQHHLETLGKA